MGLLDFAGALAKVAVRTAILPVAIVKDVATMGGAITDEPCATAENISKSLKELEELPEQLDK